MPVSIVQTNGPLHDVKLFQSTVHGDERGSFVEAFNEPQLAEHGLDAHFVQDNVSVSRKGTLRGLHFQEGPYAQGKLVRAIRGSVYDVAVDIRPFSPTFGDWTAATLTAQNGLSMWIPPGFAHGFLALENETTFFYKCTSRYTPDAERSISHKDPFLAIEWPIEPVHISERDAKALPLTISRKSWESEISY